MRRSNETMKPIVHESNRHLPVVVIGAGPVGLAAASHLFERQVPFVILEAGRSSGTNILDWGHVRLFTPWRFLTDPASVRLLQTNGWDGPDADALPTGAELVDRYLAPLAAVPEIAANLETNTRVIRVSKLGVDKMKTANRDDAPFVVQVERADGSQSNILASAVVDASGTWATPNPAGAGGVPALGEGSASNRIAYGIPDVSDADRATYIGRRTLVVGAGHSAANVILDLVKLADTDPDTKIVWAVRGQSPVTAFGGGDADDLPARGALGSRLRSAVERGAITVHTSFSIESFEFEGDGSLVVRSDDDQSIVVDHIVVATGQRPDLDLAREIRLDLDSRLESPSQLAPLIDPNHHSCGTVPPHGYDMLSHPERGYFIAGIKSYGRAPTFLIMTGYEQVRSIVAALAGDLESARNLELVLPETGVCSTSKGADACCVPLSGGEGSACCGSTSVEKVQVSLSMSRVGATVE